MECPVREIISGAKYSGVPASWIIIKDYSYTVKFFSFSFSFFIVASPKSVNLTWPFVESKIFSGFKSR